MTWADFTNPHYAGKESVGLFEAKEVSFDVFENVHGWEVRLHYVLHETAWGTHAFDGTKVIQCETRLEAQMICEALNKAVGARSCIHW